MIFLYTFGPVLLATLLAVAGWLVKRNEDQHEALGAKVGELREGQAEIKTQLDGVDKRLEGLERKLDNIKGWKE